MTLTFPAVLERLQLDAFDLCKLIETFVRHIPGLPRDLKRHLFSIEEKMLESLAWARGSSLYPKLVSACADPSGAPPLFSPCLLHGDSPMLSSPCIVWVACRCPGGGRAGGHGDGAAWQPSRQPDWLTIRQAGAGRIAGGVAAQDAQRWDSVAPP